MSTKFQSAGQKLSQIRANLARHIELKAIVKDGKIGFILIKEVNHCVNPEILREAAEITTGLFLKNLPERLQPQVVIGVPNRGKEFATALGLLIDCPIGVSDRTEIKHNEDRQFWAKYDQKEDILTINGIPSFTKPDKVFTHTVRGVKPGSTVLVADDFSATGTATDYYLKAFKLLKINPVFVYLVAKDFPDLNPPQIGYRKNKTKGLPVFAVVRLTKINEQKVIVTSQDI